MIITRNHAHQRLTIIFILILHYVTNEWQDSTDALLPNFTMVPPSTDDFDWSMMVVPLVLPISNMYDFISYSSTRLRLAREIGKKSHSNKLEQIQAQVRTWKVEGKGRKMCTSRPQWMSITLQPKTYKNRMYQIDLDLEDILEIDIEKAMVKVEPMLTIGMLNRALVERGFTLPVVPELDQLTIGGLVMGGGIESTSHIYGLFDRICTEYELVLADANVIIANQHVNGDVFYSVPFSYGTLGFLTAVTLKIVPYKPYIRLEYIPTRSLDETVMTFEKVTQDTSTSDSVEGIMFSHTEAVIMKGTFVDEDQVERHLINNIGLWFKPWFYLHVASALSTGRRIEYIPTLQFHQRHNKPAFWLTHVMLSNGHTFLMRLLFGWMLPVNAQLAKRLRNLVHPGDHDNVNSVIQDFLIPLPHLKTTLEFSFETIDITPIWLCPTKGLVEWEPEEMKPKGEDAIFVDLGFYGFTRKIPETHRRDVIRKCERFTIDHNGWQAMYADTYLTKEEFHQMFPHASKSGLYQRVRERLPLCKEGFPDVYDKISKTARES